MRGLLWVVTAFAASASAGGADGGQAGDPARGAELYAQRCGACHSLLENGPGPSHHGVFGRRAGTQPGFDYSPALRRSRIVWTRATLERWLANPDAFVPGNKMAVRLAEDPRDRADLIAWLEQASAAR